MQDGDSSPTMGHQGQSGRYLGYRTSGQARRTDRQRQIDRQTDRSSERVLPSTYMQDGDSSPTMGHQGQAGRYLGYRHPGQQSACTVELLHTPVVDGEGEEGHGRKEGTWGREGVWGDGQMRKQYSAMPNYTILYHTVPYHAMPHHTTPCHTILCHTTPYHTTLHYTIPYHTIPYHTIPYHTTLYHTIPHYAIPYCTIPHHTIPYHTMQYHTKPYTFKSYVEQS